MSSLSFSPGLWTWGNGSNGQLGLGAGLEEGNIFSPREVNIWGQLAPPEQHSPKDDSDGDDDEAMDVDADAAEPAFVVRQIAGGVDHTAILTNRGRLYVCGSNDYSQLGHESSPSRFGLVGRLADYELKSVACGALHTLAIDKFGQTYAWGSNQHGQLGHGSDEPKFPFPRLIRGLAAVHVVQVSAGRAHTLVLADNGTLYSFGDNTHGQLGLGTIKGRSKVAAPQVLDCLRSVSVKTIACGGDHSVVVAESGSFFAWGKNNSGQLGIGQEVEYKSYPTEVTALRRANVMRVACGEEHTVCLTKDGGVWTFGHGGYGQLGHGNKHNETKPKRLFELMGSEVSQIACGQWHTLAYVASRGKLYAFGLGGSGQLGCKNNQNASVPQIVQEPWLPGAADDARDVQLYTMGAGGKHSLAAVSSSSSPVVPYDQRLPLADNQRIKTLSRDLLDRLASLSVDQELSCDDLLPETIATVFQSPACLNASLLRDDHCPCVRANSGLDMDAWRRAYEVVRKCDRDSIRESIHAGLTLTVLELIRAWPSPDMASLRIFLTLPLYHGFGEPTHYVQLHVPFARVLLSLSKTAWTVVEGWYSEQSPDYLRRLVDGYKAAVAHVLRNNSSTSVVENTGHSVTVTHLDQESYDMLSFLRCLNRVNVKHNLINHEDFYIPEVRKLFHLVREYSEWLRVQVLQGAAASPRESICEFPFVFDAKAKTDLLQTDQLIQMQMTVGKIQSHMRMQPWNMYHISQQEINYLILNVRRGDHLVNDTLNGLIQSGGGINFKKPLKIIFEGEDADDVGGVTKEFFQLLIEQLLREEFGMFTEYKDSHTLWFNRHALAEDEDKRMFHLIGCICGMAIYNFTIINLPFPLVLYKKLLAAQKDDDDSPGKYVATLDDLEQLDPMTAGGLRKLLQYDGDDVEDVFCLNFEFSDKAFGEVHTVPLKENGQDVAVTRQNKEEYVQLYCDYVINKSVENHYKQFHRGFHQVCGGRVLDLFHPKELMTLVVGNENYDWKALEESTEYKNGFSAEHPTIRHFWSVFHSLDLSDKRKFLLFLTGCDRIPLLGIKALNMKIQKTNDPNRLPVAHTCFNLLDLPEYSTREKLKYKLMQAIQCTKGFGLV